MLRRLVLALLAGLGLWLAQPGHDYWWLAPVGIALLCWATESARPGRAAVLGLVAGWAYFLPTLSWSNVYVGNLPWLALATLEAAYLAAAGALLAVLQQRYRPRLAALRHALAVGGVWVCMEWARSVTPYGGFPWARVSFSQGEGPFLRYAALAGAPGVTFAVAFCGGLLASSLCLLGTRSAHARWQWMVGVVVGAAIVPIAGFSVPIATEAEQGSANVLAVQGNVPRAGLDFNAERRMVLDNHARVTIEAAARASRVPDLVVWPENAADIDPLRNEDAARVVADTVSMVKAPLLLGGAHLQGERLLNMSWLYEPGTSGPTAGYAKRHVVPFAEYIPHRDFFRRFSDKVDLVQRDYQGGDEVGRFVLARPGGGEVVAGPLICFEVAYDDLTRDVVDAGANLLVVQTNNATFGWTDESVQQLAISRLRAVEQGRSVVHISTVGVSALITPDGTAHQRTSLYTADALNGDLPLRSSRTVAGIVGAWPERSAIIALVLAWLGPLVRRRVRSWSPST